MTSFARAADGTPIAYDSEGVGAPVLLIHGFAASRIITWRNTGWYDWLKQSGRRIIAMDCRGHGESGKPHASDAYDEGLMAGDALAVLDACGEAHADVMGYSMGGYLTIRALHNDIEKESSRIRRAIIGGLGAAYFAPWEERARLISEGLLAPDMSAVSDAVAREFRRFAEAAKNDLAALAACIMRPRHILSPAELAKIAQPVLVICGEKDDMSGPPEPLAASFGAGRAVQISGKNHFSAVGDRLHKQAAADFLDS